MVRLVVQPPAGEYLGSAARVLDLDVLGVQARVRARVAARRVVVHEANLDLRIGELPC